jgi:hypothetical protein
MNKKGQKSGFIATCRSLDLHYKIPDHVDAGFCR